MPETDIDVVTKEELYSELRSSTQNFIILDCRSSNEYQESHIRTAVNFSIPSIMLRRLAAGKIDLTSTIKSRDLKQRIQNGYSNSLFILYNDNFDINNSVVVQQQHHHHHHHQHHQQQQQHQSVGSVVGGIVMCNSGSSSGGVNFNEANIINVLHRRLKQDGCRVVCLEDGFTNFRDAFPEWCDDDSSNTGSQTNRGGGGTGPTEQLMGLRSLRISTTHSDSACSSSAESSDCESSSHHPLLSEAPVQILPGLYLGNASHSSDSRALQKYNIRYVLNVTPDLPNAFEGSGDIEYLQIPITDHWSQDLAVHFPNAIEFIDKARTTGSAVLVHCLAGVSRSVTVTLAYLMHAESYCLNDAFTFVRELKPDVSPNFHFMQQLYTFERQLATKSILDDKIESSTTCTLQNCNENCLLSNVIMDEEGLQVHQQKQQSEQNLTDSCKQQQQQKQQEAPAQQQQQQQQQQHQQQQHQHQHHQHNFQHYIQQQPSKILTKPTKYSCGCTELDCKCMHTDILGTGIGVSPDSGIEFDRWTPGDGTPK